MIQEATNIVRILQENNHHAYFVGGCVRDTLRKRNISDVDIATLARPEQVISLFSKKYKVIPTGIAHGTVTVVTPNHSFEITTFRKDVSCDGRNATVQFTNCIVDDLSRRDFTMNAVAYDPISVRYLDPYDGIGDIKNNVLRSVGHAYDRFREHYLRIFRAARFYAVFNMQISDDITSSIQNLSDNDFTVMRKLVSPERIKGEFDKCFAKAEAPSKMLGVLALHPNLLDVAKLGELTRCNGFVQNKYHKYDVYGHTIRTLDAVPKEYPLIRYSALFHDLGKLWTCKDYGTDDASFHGHERVSEKIAVRIMRDLKFSCEEINFIANLVRHHMFQYNDKMTNTAIRRIVTKLGKENIEPLLILKYADRVGNGTKKVFEMDLKNTGLMRRFEELTAGEQIFSMKNLAISGYDVMNILNITEGKNVGRILKMVYDVVMDRPSANDRDYLLAILPTLVDVYELG